MAEKVTTMVLKVDLQCPHCYKKVKKILCKFPQIRDQVYDAKKNTVTITVVCCNPEKIRDKLCCRGGKTIQCIEIVVPKEKPKVETEKPGKSDKQTQTEKPGETDKPPAPPCKTVHVCVPVCPVRPCKPCYEGYPWSPCYPGCGLPSQPCDCGCGRGYCDPYGPYGRPCYATRCDCYTEGNPSCTIM